MDAGFSSAEVENQLIAKGLDADRARSMVRSVGKERRSVVRTAGRRNMLIGGGICLAGLVFTAISFQVAVMNDWSRFVVASGAIGIGLLQFFTGSCRWFLGRLSP
jgi:hypothetical protein